MFFGVGSKWPASASLAKNVAGHAAVGCISATMSGGNCGSGALASGIADYATPSVATNGFQVAENTAYLAIVGGATSVIAGGKFANGAETAAFGYLFNCLGHPQTCASMFGKAGAVTGAAIGLGASGGLDVTTGGLAIPLNPEIVVGGAAVGGAAGYGLGHWIDSLTYSDSDQPNENNLDKIKGNKAGNEAAQGAGYDDAHDAKAGRGESSVNIYNDKTTGRKWLWNGKSGSGKEEL